METTTDTATAFEKCLKQNVDLIIVDLDNEYLNRLNFIMDLRKNQNSKSKKIISIHSSVIHKSDVYSAGCDSIMLKEEIKKIINNVLQF